MVSLCLILIWETQIVVSWVKAKPERKVLLISIRKISRVSLFWADLRRLLCMVVVRQMVSFWLLLRKGRKVNYRYHFLLHPNSAKRTWCPNSRTRMEIKKVCSKAGVTNWPVRIRMIPRVISSTPEPTLSTRWPCLPVQSRIKLLLRFHPPIQKVLFPTILMTVWTSPFAIQPLFWTINCSWI